MVSKSEAFRCPGARYIAAFAVMAAAVAAATGASSTRTVFPLVNDGVADSNLTATAGGIGLAVERRILIKISGDTLSKAPLRSRYSDVAAVGIDTFSIWYVDTNTDRVASQGIKLTPDRTVITSAAVTSGAITAPLDCYLHADQGAGGFFISHVQRGAGSYRYLRVGNGTAAGNIDSATGWLFPSQGVLAGDTFLVVCSFDMDRTILRKVYSRGATINVMATAVVANATGLTGDLLMNCAVAADPAGNICAVTTRGTSGGNKFIEYRFFGRDLSPGPSGGIADPVAPDSFYFYDDVVVTSTGTGRFALVAWDAAGVMLHELTLTGNTVQKVSQRVIGVAGAKFCTVAANARYLIIACIGDADRNGIGGIEGVKFSIVNNTLGPSETFSYSDPSTAVQTVDRYSTAINSAIDDSGTVVITWRHQSKIAACIWSHRSIRYARGFYTSPVESLSTRPDSVEYSPAQVILSSLSSWFTEDSLRYGTSPAACAAAPWVSLSNAAVLHDNRSVARYYQYRIAMCRKVSGVIDSFSTPTLSGVTIPWNRQPRIDPVDSVVVGSSKGLSVAFGDTVDVVARLDSMHCFLHGSDDDGGSAVIDLSLPSTPDRVQLTGGPDYRTVMTVLPLADADAVVPCTLTIDDAAGWRGQPRVLYVRPRNLLPQLSCRMVTYDRTVLGDTATVGTDTVVVIQAEDSVSFVYAAADSNDAATVRGYLNRRKNGADVRLDSALSGAPATYRVHGDTVIPVDTVRFFVAAQDVDTTRGLTVRLLVNHAPQLRWVIQGGDTLYENDTANVPLDDTVYFSVAARDTDCIFGDTLFFRSHLVARPDSTRSANQVAMLAVVPALGDTQVLLSVTDRFGRADSMRLRLAYPWYETDSLKNPGYTAARRALAKGPSLIVGAAHDDTVSVPVLNTGHDPLRLTGIEFQTSGNRWLRVVVEGPDTSFGVTAADTGFPHPVVVMPGATVALAFIMTASGLVGDSVVAETVRLFTDDPEHRSDTFFVNMEYNDLPRIVTMNPDFIVDRPYRSFAKRPAYRFPPHASIAVTFSEPVDSASATAGVHLYSIPDMRVRGNFEALPLRYDWTQNYTSLRISPHYETASPAFKLLPPEGLFIPTDSLLLVLSDSTVDRARTPSGPNALDINRDNKRGPESDTGIGLRVDSIGFMVDSIDPSPGRTDIERNVRIGITFSTPVYAASVDTSLVHNRSLQVTSTCNSGQPLRFSSVSVEGARVVFTIAQELFYRDSLYCRYGSRWISDRLGFAADNNGDGIDATMFDSAAGADDLSWGYRVRTIRVATVDPDSETTVSAISPPVTIRFDGPLPSGVIDTDTSRANRSFIMGSGRTGPTSFREVQLSGDGMGVTFRPKMVFFSNDSIYCKFTGFSASFRYDSIVNMPEGSDRSFGRYEWTFRSANVGFYTYPNPYKPRLDQRHCAAGGPCGIWFKNLHALAVDLREVSIAVFSMNAHPVFDTRTTGEKIVFSPESEVLPQWRWDTRNNHGDPVASGIYLYAIYSTSGTVLKKGKIIIVR